MPLIAVSGDVLCREGQAPEPVSDLSAAIAAADGPDVRWLWASTEQVYPALLEKGVRVRRCHDIELTESLLLGYAGRHGAPRSLAAASARLNGIAVPDDQPVRQAQPPGDGQGSLFGTDLTPAPPVESLLAVYAHQRDRMDKADDPARMRLLVAADSASALVAAEMGQAGLPWDEAAHDEVLTSMLGRPLLKGGRPQRLTELAAAISGLLGVPGLHPESPAELRKALHRVEIDVPNTRSWTLKSIDHEVIPLILEYKELYRIWTAHGWAWQDQWVHRGRFHPAYIVAGVVSGRWATRGGGALQIPKAVRSSVRADPGWRLVVADAGQLEPRILAAVAGDPALARAAAQGDLYEALAISFGGDRASAKLALLGAMYGQTGGGALPALAVLRNKYTKAWDYVEAAARTGEGGGMVRSWLGRTSPTPSRMLELPREQRSWGRFTRNFVIQATAAEWAGTLLALVRNQLWDSPAQLVFFQHDEVMVHCPQSEVDTVVAALASSGQRTGELLFGNTQVRFPLNVAVVDSYANAK